MSEQFPDYDDILRRCCRCATFKGNDPDDRGAETSDGAYLCPVCKRAILDEVEWPLEFEAARQELVRLRAENEALKQIVLATVEADARR